MTTMTEKPATPYSYWLSFVTEWDRLSDVYRDLGQTELADFLGELSDDAADVWSGFYGPLGDGS